VSLYAETNVAVEKALLQSSRNGKWVPTPMRFATIFAVPRMRFDPNGERFTVKKFCTRKNLEGFDHPELTTKRPRVTRVRQVRGLIAIPVSCPTLPFTEVPRPIERISRLKQADHPTKP